MNPELSAEEQLIEDYNNLVYAVFSTPNGQELLKHFKNKIMSASYHQGLDQKDICYYEGVRAAYRHIIETYDSIEN